MLMTFTARRPLAALLLAAAAPLAAPAAHALPLHPAPVAAARVAVDPTGTFEWSIEAQGQTFSGTIVVTKVNDTTFAATVGHATLGESSKASSVKLEGDILTVVSTTQYGALTQQIKFGDPLEGRWQLGAGEMGGEMRVARQKKQP